MEYFFNKNDIGANLSKARVSKMLQINTFGPFFKINLTNESNRVLK